MKPTFDVSAYGAYRPGYPVALFEAILAELRPPYRRGLDLGAGTGLSTIPLCRWFDEVIAVEPDESMAGDLEKAAPQVTVQRRRAEEIDELAAQNPGFDLVTCGAAFYWFDGPRVVSLIADVLRPGGILAVYRYGFPGVPAAVHEVFETEIERRWDRYRHPRLKDPNYSRRVIGACESFAGVRVREVANVVELTPLELVGFFSSTSYASAYTRTLERPQRYLDDLLARVTAAVSGSDRIAADFALELIVARTGE